MLKAQLRFHTQISDRRVSQHDLRQKVKNPTLYVPTTTLLSPLPSTTIAPAATTSPPPTTAAPTAIGDEEAKVCMRDLIGYFAKKGYEKQLAMRPKHMKPVSYTFVSGPDQFACIEGEDQDIELYELMQSLFLEDMVTTPNSVYIHVCCVEQ